MRLPLAPAPAALWTIGHSTLPIEAFIANLESNGVGTLVDVRRHAGSRRHPQFNPVELASALRSHAIEYVPMPALGGRRKPSVDSPNVNWRNTSFRGYADYMQTPEFGQAAARLARIAEARATAIMCAEALWWRCHRSLIADAFEAAGTEVWNIETDGHVTSHPYTSAAHIVAGELTYGSAGDLFGERDVAP
jgi:uncharacterized protein (DUF488 family)